MDIISIMAILSGVVSAVFGIIRLVFLLRRKRNDEGNDLGLREV